MMKMNRRIAKLEAAIGPSPEDLVSTLKARAMWRLSLGDRILYEEAGRLPPHKLTEHHKRVSVRYDEIVDALVRELSDTHLEVIAKLA